MDIGQPRYDDARRSRMRAFCIFALSILSLVAFAACKPTTASPIANAASDAAAHDAATASMPSAEPVALDGATLYSTMCAVCHGADAKGYKADNAPSLVN